MTDQAPFPALDTLEAAAYLRLAPSTLITWRSRRTGPPYIKSGGRVLYLLTDLHAWLDSRRVVPSN